LKRLKDILFHHWLGFLLLFLGLYSNVFQITGFNLQNIPGDLGDTRFIMAIVEYNYQWLIGNYSEYWDGFFMYPDQKVISYSDNLLGTLPIYSIFRVLGADYLYAFQLLILIAHTLNFVIAYLCFYRFTSNSLAAASGAFIFAFSLGLAGLYNHPQFSFRFGIPLFFLYFNIYLNSHQFKHLIYAILALVVQFYLGIYLGYFLLVCGAFYLLSFVIVNYKTIHLKQMTLDTLKTIPILVLALFPLFFEYIKRGLNSEYYNDYNYYMQTIPRLGSYLKAFEGAYLWGFLNATNIDSEYPWLHYLFPGGIVLLSLVFAIPLSIKKNRNALVLLITMVLIISFTTYYEGHTMYGYLMKIPGIKAARVVSRIITILLLFSGWLVCVEINYILKYKPGLNLFISIAIPFLLFVDNYTLRKAYKTFSIEDCRSRINLLESKLRSINPSNSNQPFAYLFTDTINTHIKHLDAMLCALKTNRKTINGYSSSCHRYFGPFWQKPNATSLKMWCSKMNLKPDSLVIIK